jgi:ActR/RegA family two-component response regulator
MQDAILVVDDENSVRQTVREWLVQAQLDCEVLTASDAESALMLANNRTIDLAILDWNLGAGDDGLQLLQDLAAFHPAIVAIMITGFANMATPLDAMRMGVRDYLDKNHDFNRETLIKSVRKQLEQLRPAKQVRRLHQILVDFRNAVGQIVPLVQSAAALNDPVPLPDAVRSLVRFLMQVTQARAGLLLARHYDEERSPAEITRVYDADGQAMPGEPIPFARSAAGSAVSRGQPCVMNELAQLASGSLELQPFERGHANLLAVPMAIAAGAHVVVELFDKTGGFNADDQHVARAAADLGTELIRQAVGQKRTHQLLFDAVAAALKASDSMTPPLGTPDARDLPSPQVIEQLRAGLSNHDNAASAELSLQLAEAIRVLAVRHGEPALQHCLTLVESVRALLDQATDDRGN